MAPLVGYDNLWDFRKGGKEYIIPAQGLVAPFEADKAGLGGLLNRILEQTLLVKSLGRGKVYIVGVR